MAAQPDFKAQMTAINEFLFGCAEAPFFIPKLHCEFNFMEGYWAHAKQYSKKHCLCSLPGLRKTVPASLSMPVDADDISRCVDCKLTAPHTDLPMLRRFARLAWHWFRAYKYGLVGGAALAYVKKQHNPHRAVRPSADAAVEAAVAAAQVL